MPHYPRPTRNPGPPQHPLVPQIGESEASRAAYEAAILHPRNYKEDEDVSAAAGFLNMSPVGGG